MRQRPGFVPTGVPIVDTSIQYHSDGEEQALLAAVEKHGSMCDRALHTGRGGEHVSCLRREHGERGERSGAVMV